jgi:hypothetical protein
MTMMILSFLFSLSLSPVPPHFLEHLLPPPTNHVIPFWGVCTSTKRRGLRIPHSGYPQLSGACFLIGCGHGVGSYSGLWAQALTKAFQDWEGPPATWLLFLGGSRTFLPGLWRLKKLDS